MIAVIILLVIEYILMVLTNNSAYFHVNSSLCYYASMILLTVLMIVLILRGYKYSKDYKEKLLLDYQKELQDIQFQQSQSFKETVENNHRIKQEQLEKLKLLKTKLENKDYTDLPVLENNQLSKLYCEDTTLNSVLNVKYDLAQSKSITLDIHVQLASSYGIDVFDLSTIIFNLLDNAINASKLSKQKYISLDIHYKEPYILIDVLNSYIDTKDMSLMHGYGTIIVDELVNKYNGHIQVSKDDLYHTSIFLTEKK